MSRTEARIHVSCWEDFDFLALGLNAQHAFFLLISQPNITFAGQITLNIRGWASMAGVGAIRFRRTLAELEAKRFVIIDETTGELWIRTFVKYDGVLSGPNLIVAMTRDYAHIRSARIKDALISQLGEGFREGLPEGLWERLAEPFREGFREPLSRVCAPAHAEPPSPSPKDPPKPPQGGNTENPSPRNGNGNGNSHGESNPADLGAGVAALRASLAGRDVNP